jgi:membrane protease YdiL (CAAX protease family)
MALIQTLKRHALLTYFVLVYVLTLACWIPVAISKNTASFPFLVLVGLGLIMPSLVGILLTALFSGKSGLGELFRRLGQVRVPLIWYAVVLLLPAVLLFVAIGVHMLLGGAPIAYAWSGFLATLVVNGFGAGLGEELGWRGFALPRMLARKPALAASLLLGVLWGLWHLPQALATGTISASFILFVLMITAYAVLFTWVYNHTKGSLFLMVLFHAALTTTNLMFLAPQRDLIVYILYVILLWVAVTLVVVREGATRLSRSSTLAPA